MISQPIKIIIVDDHALVRKGMRILLDGLDEICVIGEAANGLQAIDLAERLEPDVVLMDLDMPVMDGIEAIHRILAIRPDQRIIVITGYLEDDRLIQAIKAGAQGYLVKTTDTEDLVRSIRDVYEGKPFLDPYVVCRILRNVGERETSQPKDGGLLTERELEILRLLTLGKSDHEIADLLVVTDVTVRTHISRILNKLHLKNRVQAALYCLRLGLVSIYELDSLERSDPV